MDDEGLMRLALGEAERAMDGGDVPVGAAVARDGVVLARVDRLVIGAMDPKAGFVGSLGDLARDPRLNHRVEVATGVLGEECGEVLRAFFRDRRA